MDVSNTRKYDRKQIAIRLLYSILFMVVLEFLKSIIQLTVVFQYVYLLITRSYSNPARRFANKVSTYAYRVMRYLSLNENIRPFPFSEIPEEQHAPVDEVEFK